jgi:hypothetical protein
MNATKSGFSLLDILLLAGLERRTGELTIESGNNIGTILFHDGKILLAFSPYTRAIGDVLVDDGTVTDVELLKMLQQQRIGPYSPMGSLLRKSGKVTFSTIEAMVQDQIRGAISDFLSWNPVELTFVKKDVQPFDTIHMPVYEFLPTDILQSAAAFVDGMASTPKSSVQSDKKAERT